MNKWIALFLTSILVMPFVACAGPANVDVGGTGIHEPGTGIDQPEIKGTGQTVTTTTMQNTSNQGQDKELTIMTQERQSLKSGEYTVGINGDQMQIQTQTGEQTKLRVGDAEAHSSLNMTMEKDQNRTRIDVYLSNGAKSEVKIMPNVASETAIARLRLHVCNESNNCTLQLKEVGTGNQTRAAYEVQAEKEVKLFGLFKTRMGVSADVDAENGNILRENAPWWAALAIGS